MRRIIFWSRQLRAAVVAVWLGSAMTVSAEDGYQAWLRYEAIDDAAVRQRYEALPTAVVALKRSEVVQAASDELVRGFQSMLDRELRQETVLHDESAIVLATLETAAKVFPQLPAVAELQADGLPADSFLLARTSRNGRDYLLIVGVNDRGVLYGAFTLLRKMALHEPLDALNERHQPYAPIRIVNQWDNLNGSIERGYAGWSIFFYRKQVLNDLTRARDFARLLASVGINGCAVNNVNAGPHSLRSEFLPQLARIAQAFRPWGVRLFISVDFTAPVRIGGLETFDPLDPHVQQWWQRKAEEVYRHIPDFGGFVVKVDSEGRLGPTTFNRTHADAANTLARALRPYGGIVFYRGFVYNHKLDWRDLKSDRARAAYENFAPLDGQFDDNVVVQIKHGPIDFQVREPASPLFGALEKTNQAVEVQITQEYTGHQRHLCYLAPMWKEVLDFDLQARPTGSTVKELVAGKTFRRPIGGFVGVSNVGNARNWLNNHLALANLYSFGRLAWNADRSAEQIVEQWTRLTFGHDPHVVETIVNMQLRSWPLYESYTGPLGVGTLTDVATRWHHYGPDVESSERNGWGQWHRADETAIGTDRTAATGTRFIGQYRPSVARQFETIDACPDEVLLFMHRVGYTHCLRSGKTVIQHIYDTHYEGAEGAQQVVDQWKSLEGRVDDERYRDVLKQLQYQAGHAQVWRDAICTWFLAKSGIEDEKGRAGNFPHRVEAEEMQLEGYEVEPVTPWETASGGQCVKCVGENRGGAVSFRHKGSAGRYNLTVAFFDEEDGTSEFRLLIAGRTVDRWLADEHPPDNIPNGHTASRRTMTGQTLQTGDEIRLEAIADEGEHARIDFIEVAPCE